MSFEVRKNPVTLAREAALQFLYQCEVEKIYYYNEGAFDQFVGHFNLAPETAELCRPFVQGVLENLPELDRDIASSAENWTVQRMSSTDRNVLRLAVFELIHKDTPKKVVLNEAIELAKSYGTENSGRFVNGVLDRLAKSLAGK